MIWWILGIVVAFIFFWQEMIKIGTEVQNSNSSNLSVNDEQKIRQYIQKRAEMKRNCDGMWSLRGIGGKSNSEIIALCKPLGYDVKSKTWRYEPESVKKVLRKYGIYDQESTQQAIPLHGNTQHKNPHFLKTLKFFADLRYELL